MKNPSSTPNMADACWRAAIYCLYPRIILLSFIPLFICIGIMAALGWFFWTDAVTTLTQAMSQWTWLAGMFEMFSQWGLSNATQWLAGFVLLLVTVPLAVVVSLLLVALFMTPTVINLVAKKRFPTLVVSEQTPWWTSLAWSISASALAVIAFLISLPLWWIPLFGMLIGPLIWGWLTYRVMAFDALSGHATHQERKALLKTYRIPLLTMGVVCGFLGAAPSMIWAFSAMTFVFAPFMLAVSLWLYTLVFAFASLWFTHYLLAALQVLREQPLTTQAQYVLTE